MLNPPSGDEANRILLVDDDPTILETSKMMLEMLGYQVSAVTSADAALAALDEDHYSLVLTDLDMPKVDGRALAKKIRDKGVEIPVVVVSGYFLDENDWAPDFSGVLMKPFRIQDLQEKVEELLKKA